MPGEEHPVHPEWKPADALIALIPVALFILFFYLLYRIFAPFLMSIIWAIVLGMLFTPLHRRLLVRLRMRRSLSALAMTLLVILVIVIPATFLSVVIAKQAVKGATSVADAISELAQEGPGRLTSLPLYKKIEETVTTHVDLKEANVREALLRAIQQLSKKALDFSTSLLGNAARLLFHLLVMLFTLYYIFKDGESATRYVEGIHPMIRQTRMFHTLEELTITTFYAGFVVAAVQGILAGLAFAVLGVPSALFWGAMTSLMSFVPFVGATSIWVPVVIWLLIQGAWAKAIGMAIWGFGVVSLADNFLKPALISGRLNLHPLLVFFSVLGGLGFFGPIGVILGPLVLVLCLGFLNSMVARPSPAGD